MTAAGITEDGGAEGATRRGYACARSQHAPSTPAHACTHSAHSCTLLRTLLAHSYAHSYAHSPGPARRRVKAWPGGGGKAHRAGGPRAGGRPTGPTNVRVTGRLLGWRRGDLRVLGGGPGGGDTMCYHLRAVRRPVRGRGGVHRACATPRSQALSELADFTKEKRSSSLPQPASRP